MSLGRRREKQVDLFIPATQIAKGSGHPFYSKLGEVLKQLDVTQTVKGGPAINTEGFE